MPDKYAQLHPDLQKVYTEAKASYLADHPGLAAPSLDCTYRSNACQTAYHAQGRLPLAQINALRKLAGLDSIGPSEAKNKITNAIAGQSPHNFLPARALDVIFTLNGKALWTDALYIAFGQYMKRAALKLDVAISYGGDWVSFKDFPHSELKFWKSM